MNDSSLNSSQFDVVILGTGPSASRIASACAAGGKSVAVSDAREIGGTCALRGCNPKKVLVNAAELIDWAQRSSGQLVDARDISIDWKQLMEFKRSFTEPVPENKKESFGEKGITIIESAGRFVGPAEIVFDDIGATVKAEQIVIATGARPRDLEIQGTDHVITSDDFLDLDELPQRVVFLGGGYISCEFANVARCAGAEVKVLEINDRILAGFEKSLVARLTESMVETGIEIHTRFKVVAIDKTQKGFCVVGELGGEERHIEADLVVHGAGRVPNIDQLDLDTGGVEYGEHGITVDDHLRSVTNPVVFAAGDVADTPQPKLTPVANEQGQTIAASILENSEHVPNYGIVPRVVFSLPPLAAIGMDESQARQAGYDVDVRDGDMSSWGSVRKVGGRVAAYKIIVDKSTDRLLGAHLLGPGADESINLFAFAMKYGHTASDLKSVLFAFPTGASDVRDML